jgi:DnaK suppressor protein
MVLKKESKNKRKSIKDSKKATSPQKEKIVSLKDVKAAKKTRKTIVSKVKHKLPVKFKNEIKKMLNGMSDEILKDISKIIKTESNHLKHDVGDFYDNASNDRERDMSLSLNQRDRQKLVMIEDAIKRIESGSYGMCPACQEPIDENRLRVMPFTRYCLSCMEEEEFNTNNL